MHSTTAPQTFVGLRTIAFIIDLTIGLPLTAFFPVAYPIYEAACVNQWGQTFGKFVVGLRVVKQNDATKIPEIWSSIKRGIGGAFTPQLHHWSVVK